MAKRHYKIQPPENLSSYKTTTALLRWHRSAKGREEYPRCSRLSYKLLKTIVDTGRLNWREVDGRKWWPPETSALINQHILDKQLASEATEVEREKKRQESKARERRSERYRRQRRRQALVNGQTTPDPNLAVKHRELYAALMDMPALSHWRDRRQAWSMEESDVLLWILDRLYDFTEYGEKPYMRTVKYANYIFGVAKKGCYIVYDSQSKTWSGWNTSSLNA